MSESTASVQAHWTRRGVLARVDAVLSEMGHDPEKLTPEEFSLLSTTSIPVA